MQSSVEVKELPTGNDHAGAPVDSLDVNRLNRLARSTRTIDP